VARSVPFDAGGNLQGLPEITGQDGQIQPETFDGISQMTKKMAKPHTEMSGVAVYCCTCGAAADRAFSCFRRGLEIRLGPASDPLLSPLSRSILYY
jgi:hypothetical protein